MGPRGSLRTNARPPMETAGSASARTPRRNGRRTSNRRALRALQPRGFVHCLHQPSGLIGPRTVLHVPHAVSTGAGTKFRQPRQNWSSLSECCRYWLSSRVRASAGWRLETSEQSRPAPSRFAFSRSAAVLAAPPHPASVPAPAAIASPTKRAPRPSWGFHGVLEQRTILVRSVARTRHQRKVFWRQRGGKRYPARRR